MKKASKCWGIGRYFSLCFPHYQTHMLKKENNERSIK